MSLFSLGDLPKGPRFGPDKDSECRPYDMPFSPFNPLDKLGRVADWLSQDDQGHHHQRNNQVAHRGAHNQQNRGGSNQQNRGVSNQQNRGGSNQRGIRSTITRNDRQHADTTESSFGFKQEYDESSFATVDASGRTAAVVVPTAPILVGRGGSSQRGRPSSTRGGDSRGGNSSFRGQSSRGASNRPYHHGRGGYRGGHHFQQRVVRESSLVVHDNWAVAGEIDLPKIQKHGAMDHVPEPETIKSFGSVAAYAKQYDRLTTKNEQALQVSDRSNAKSLTPSTLEDPILLSLIDSTNCTVPTICATDSIISQVMNAPRAIYSWDLIVTRVGDHAIILDKRPGASDLASVNENAQEPPQDHPSEKDFVNNPSNLALEATYIGANYSQQVLDHSKRTALGPDTPFHASLNEEERPSAAFVYKQWKFEEYMDIVVRTEVDAISEVQGKSVTVTVRALNQAPGLPGHKLDWRKSLDTQRGAVMAMEMRNNGYKLSRWITQAVLAETELMKLGFVGRCSPRDVSRHSILGIATYKPSEFAAQMNISMAHGFGILYALAEMAIAQPPGKYVLLKDPNKPMLRLYAVTMDPLSRDFVVGSQDPFARHVVFTEGEAALVPDGDQQ